MRILIVFQSDIARIAERIEKITKSLAAAGHQVFVLCNNYTDTTPHAETLGPLQVLRLRPTFASRKLNRILKFPLFLNPLWIVQIRAAVRRLKIEALHVVDIPLAPAVLYAGWAYRIPVVLDMWENYPEALRGWSRTDWKYLIVKNYWVARAVERWVTARVDHILTVVEEQRDRLIADGIPAERISVVTNAVDMELFAAQAAVRADTPLDLEPGCYKLLYVGVLNIERGLDDIIRALKLVLPQAPHVRLYIAGTGNDEPRLRKLVAQEKLEGAVRFLGWVPFQDIHSYVLKSDLCLVPHVSNDFINTTIPNKIFQYMALAKPLLVSNAKPLARIVRSCGCGFVFQSGHPADAAARILEAFASRRDAAIGERGRRGVEQNYNWAVAEVPLLRLYGRLERGRSRPGETSRPPPGSPGP